MAAFHLGEPFLMLLFVCLGSLEMRNFTGTKASEMLLHLHFPAVTGQKCPSTVLTLNRLTASVRQVVCFSAAKKMSI